MKLLKLLKPYKGCSAGTVSTYREKTALQLIKDKIAVVHVEPVKPTKGTIKETKPA